MPSCSPSKSHRPPSRHRITYRRASVGVANTEMSSTAIVMLNQREVLKVASFRLPVPREGSYSIIVVIPLTPAWPEFTDGRVVRLRWRVNDCAGLFLCGMAEAGSCRL